MPTTVRLDEIIDALELQFDEQTQYLDLDTGKVEVIPQDLLSLAEECNDEEEPELLAWERRTWEVARRVVSTDRFRPLPTKFDVHEWAIMRDFSDTVRADRTREELTHALHGSGAFRHFKATIRRQGLDQAWFAFRREAIRQIAIDWCDENGIRWE